MKQENVLFVITLIILALMVAATVICAVRYMQAEPPWWSGDPVPAVTDAPEAGQNSPWREMVTANLPPG